MSNTFEFAERLGFDPPFEFERETNTNDEQIIVGNQSSKKPKFKIVFLKKEDYNKKYKGNYIKDLEDNNFVVFADKNIILENEGNLITVGNSINDAGISYKNITAIFNIALGKNIIKEIEKNGKKALYYISQLLDFIEVRSNSERIELKKILLSMTNNYVKEYPSSYKYYPPTGFDELFQLFQLCLELGIIDISNTAKFLSDEVFIALANQVRKAKLGENRWNPNIVSGKYEPLFGDFSETEKIVNSVLDSILISNNQEQKNKEEVSNELKVLYGIRTSTISVVNKIISWIKNFIANAIKGITSNVDKVIKLHNAYLVGLINGVIEFVASIIEAIGFLFSLLNYESLNALVESISVFFSKLDFPTIINIIKKELIKLFSFIDGDEIYKNAYEFGLFIPKIIEIILDLLGLAKGISKVVKNIADIAKELPEQIKDINIALKAFEAALKLKRINKKLIDALKQKGVTVNVNLIPVNQFNVGVPVKLFKGKKIKISYRNVDLLNTLDEVEANKLLKSLEANPDKLKLEYRKAKKKALRDSKNFKKHKDYIESSRKVYNNDLKSINRAWESNNGIAKKALNKSRAKQLDKYRTEKYNTASANIATGKVRVYDKKGNLLFERNDYLNASGKNSNIPADKDYTHGSVDKGSLSQNIEKNDFFDVEKNKFRARDAENPLLRDIEEEVILFADKKGIDIDELVIEIDMESTFIPCTICKREILLRQQHLGQFTSINVDYSIFKNGKPVTGNKEYKEYLK